jgi:hypothetical protein
VSEAQQKEEVTANYGERHGVKRNRELLLPALDHPNMTAEWHPPQIC